MSKEPGYVTISELKQSPAKVIDRAKRTGRPVPILRNNQVEGFFVPASALELITATDQEVNEALETILDSHGNAISWLADH
jgi:PHD/YefM family antitoxin component YafN of YafNO toxin-antitoxin module